MDGLRIGGTVINHLRYADDKVILAESEDQLQRLITVGVAQSEEKGLHLNSAKSFSMVCVFKVDNYSYMPHRRLREYSGTSTDVYIFIKLFSSDASCEKEIRRRIGIVKSTFTSMNKYEL